MFYKSRPASSLTIYFTTMILGGWFAWLIMITPNPLTSEAVRSCSWGMLIMAAFASCNMIMDNRHNFRMVHRLQEEVERGETAKGHWNYSFDRLIEIITELHLEIRDRDGIIDKLSASRDWFKKRAFALMRRHESPDATLRRELPGLPGNTPALPHLNIDDLRPHKDDSDPSAA